MPTFDLRMPVQFGFWRVQRDAFDNPGKTHAAIALNGSLKAVCDGHGQFLNDHEIEQRSLSEFLDDFCFTCKGRLELLS